jgi:hypothetical protein
MAAAIMTRGITTAIAAMAPVERLEEEVEDVSVEDVLAVAEVEVEVELVVDASSVSVAW